MADDHLEAVAAGDRRHVDRAHVGLGREAVGDDAAIAHARDQLLHLRMIEAEQRRAVEGHILDKLDERILHRIERTVVVEMFGIDVRDDRIGAVEAQEAAVTLVRLHHHPVRRAEAGVGAVAVDDAAVDDGRVHPARIEQRCHHRGGRRLAVRPGHRDGGLEAHQLGQHFRAADDGDALFQRLLHLGVAALDRGRGDDHRRVAEIGGLMADHHLDAAFAQAFHDIALGHVGALYGVTQIVHHLGDARHADAADADEMNSADVGGDALHASASLKFRGGVVVSGMASGVGPASLSTRSARSAVALG